MDHVCAHCDEMQREFDKRIRTLTVTKIAETASATKRVEAHMTEMVEPRVVHTDNVTSETFRTAKEIKNDVATQGDILLHIRGMLQDLLSNNECRGL